ncbi:MAG TPA: nucleotidyltransferase domain-containing protein [Candidatus Thermoplasmatota archaeon]|nr:nucleotidyltransferase domain-containing protein [Candidatus Thermoplasmatota archaeon]
MIDAPLLRLDFAFTEADTPDVRRRIASDLAHIARRAHALDARLDALVLTGGFARGEGTVRDGAPVNDYDLIAVRSRPGGDGIYRRLGEHLTSEVGLEVDLMPVWRARLPYVGRKLFWLDLRLGGRVVSGDPRALEKLRVFHVARVSRGEIARLLGNRAAGMLLSLPAPGEAPDPRQRDLQATKAVLAAMDATLLDQGIYAPGMRERLSLTAAHRDHETFATAVEWKLRPHHPLPATWWERARDVLLRAVDETHARRGRDGVVEHLMHTAKARRVASSPSQAVRRVAWDLLSISTFPDGPADLPGAVTMVRRLGFAPGGGDWGALKRTFFSARSRTLQ